MITLAPAPQPRRRGPSWLVANARLSMIKRRGRTTDSFEVPLDELPTVENAGPMTGP